VKFLTRLAAAGFALWFAIFAGIYVYIDAIAGATIEAGATYALGVDTKVGFVRLGPLTGSLRIGGLGRLLGGGKGGE